MPARRSSAQDYVCGPLQINTGGKTRSNILTIREYEQMLEELFAMPPEEQPLEAEEGPDGAADDAC
jgi:hypothetical protein